MNNLTVTATTPAAVNHATEVIAAAGLDGCAGDPCDPETEPVVLSVARGRLLIRRERWHLRAVTSGATEGGRMIARVDFSNSGLANETQCTAPPSVRTICREKNVCDCRFRKATPEVLPHFLAVERNLPQVEPFPSSERQTQASEGILMRL